MLWHGTTWKWHRLLCCVIKRWKQIARIFCQHLSTDSFKSLCHGCVIEYWRTDWQNSLPTSVNRQFQEFVQRLCHNALCNLLRGLAANICPQTVSTAHAMVVSISVGEQIARIFCQHVSTDSFNNACHGCVIER